MPLYKITALQPVSIHVTQFNSNIVMLHPNEMPKTDKGASELFATLRPPEVNEATFELTPRDSPIGDVVEIITLTTKDGPAAGRVFRSSDFRLPSARGDQASDEGLILIERTQ